MAYSNTYAYIYMHIINPKIKNKNRTVGTKLPAAIRIKNLAGGRGRSLYSLMIY